MSALLSLTPIPMGRLFLGWACALVAGCLRGERAVWCRANNMHVGRLAAATDSDPPFPAWLTPLHLLPLRPCSKEGLIFQFFK